jgi:hypothetical protein
LDNQQELNVPVASQIQFKIAYRTFSIERTTHVQVSDALIGYNSTDDISPNWEYSYNDSSNTSPTRCGFRLKSTYQTSVPSTLSFVAYDLTGVLVVNQSITSNPSNFQYSTDGGTTWLALGTIPNVVGTLVRYTFVSPPGVNIRPAIKDS